jgi:hypothetical protein
MNYELFAIVLVYHIDDSVVNVSGFRLVRLDRINSQHGGVCIIQCKIVQELLDTNLKLSEFTLARLVFQGEFPA